MIEVCVKIPKDLNDILSETGAAFYVEALKEVAGRRLGHTEKRLNELTDRNHPYLKGNTENHCTSFRKKCRTRPKPMRTGLNGHG